jgi:hypothetical protein
MNAIATMRQGGQSKKMAEARLSFELNFNTFFYFLKMFIHIFVTLCICAGYELAQVVVRSAV